ncbi:MAG: hypothetical protein AAF997_21550 [Myxococcota bacterium]
MLACCLGMCGCSSDGGWGNPERVVRADDFDAPSLFGGSSRTALAVWRESNPDPAVERQLESGLIGRWHRSGGWREFSVIDDYAGDNFREPMAAVNSAGSALVTWPVLGPADSEDAARIGIFARRYVEGEGWAETEQVGRAFSGRGYAPPRAALTPTGRGFVVYASESGREVQTFVTEFDPEEGWLDPVGFTCDACWLGAVQLFAVGASGADEVTVVYSSIDSIHVRRYARTTGWSEPLTLGGAPLGLPELAISAAGVVWAYWPTSTTRELVCPSVTKTTPSGWEDLTVLAPNCQGVAGAVGAFGAFAIDDSGGAITIWSETIEGRAETRFSRYAEGSGWSTPEVMPVGQGFGGTRIAVTMLQDQRAAALWYRLRDSMPATTATRVWGSYFEPTEGWAEPTLISQDGPTLTQTNPPEIVGFPSGRALGLYRITLERNRNGVPIPVTFLWSSEFR